MTEPLEQMLLNLKALDDYVSASNSAYLSRQCDRLIELTTEAQSQLVTLQAELDDARYTITLKEAALKVAREEAEINAASASTAWAMQQQIEAEVGLLTDQLRTSNHSLVSLLTGIETLVRRGRLVLTDQEQAFVDRCHDAVFVRVAFASGAALGAGDEASHT